MAGKSQEDWIEDVEEGAGSVGLPRYHELMWPTLQALTAMGGSATVQEIYEKVVELEGFTEEQQNVPHGRRSEIEYRLAWARTYLKMAGAVENSSRGVWSITDKGRELTAADIPRIRTEIRAMRRDRHSREENSEEEIGEHDWKAELLEVLWALAPDAFERLCRRLLREAGFISVRVTGKTGDEGIDGIGVYRMALVSFPVFFQAKKYRGSVASRAVRDFRGAMTGRGDKGLLITTGSFTADAKHEATREGAPPIDLIDGDRLCELLKEYSLGVETQARIIEDVAIQRNFFADI